MTGKELRDFLNTLSTTTDSFANRVGYSTAKLKRVVGKDKHKPIDDKQLLQKIYDGGLELVKVKVERLLQQMENIKRFEPMFSGLEKDLEQQEKVKKFKERFEEGE